MGPSKKEDNGQVRQPTDSSEERKKPSYRTSYARQRSGHKRSLRKWEESEEEESV